MDNNNQTSLAISLCALLFASPGIAKKTDTQNLTFNKSTLKADVALSGHTMWLHNDNAAKHLLIADKTFASRQFILFKNIDNADIQSTTVEMPNEAIAYSAGTLAGHDTEVLFYLTDSQVLSYDVTTNKQQALFTSQSIYSGEKVISPSDDISFAEDLNKDGLTDFILTDFHASHIFMQNPKGGFTKFELEMKPDTSLWRQSRTFSQQTYKLFDANNDNLIDIAYQKEDELFVHLQREKNGFDPKPTAIQLNANIISRQMVDAKERETEGKVKLDYASFVDLVDINNDGHIDLVTQRRKSDGIFNRQGTLEIRYGHIKNALIAFPASPNTQLPYEGQLMSFGQNVNTYKFADLNGDGLKDLYFPRKDFGFSDIIAGLISQSTDVNVEFFLMTEQQNFVEEPNQDKEIELAFDLDSESAEIPLFALEDFDGDGIKDLLMQISDDKARLYVGDQKGPFSRKGQRYEMPLPRNGNLVQIKDINKDGKADILFRYDRTDSEVKAKTLELWLSNSTELLVKNH
ncbi:FG-GAP repeat domain-containing protein [Thalassotalea fusca]